MLEFWRTWRARKAAVDIIRPLVERTRFVNGRIDERDWMDAYMIGFMAMLITLVAERHFRSIGQDALGNVQADAWQEITGLPGALVGEEICLLSSTRDPEFELGCENAAAFVAALAAPHDVDVGNPGAAFVGSASAGQFYDQQGDRDVWALWSDYFGRHLSA